MYYLTSCTRGLGSVTLNYYSFRSFRTKEEGEEYLKRINKTWMGVKHIDDIKGSRAYYHESRVPIE